MGWATLARIQHDGVWFFVVVNDTPGERTLLETLDMETAVAVCETWNRDWAVRR
jgi:hypothetical protein